MTITFSIDLHRPDAGSERQTIETTERSNAYTLPSDRPIAMPYSVPRAQLYYWTGKWQSDEAESLAELERGEGREFSSATDAIRWLLDPEDD